MTERDRTDLMEAARRLGVTYHAALNLVLRGVLRGERVDGHWLVEVRSVDAHAQRTGSSPRGGAR